MSNLQQQDPIPESTQEPQDDVDSLILSAASSLLSDTSGTDTQFLSHCIVDMERHFDRLSLYIDDRFDDFKWNELRGLLLTLSQLGCRIAQLMKMRAKLAPNEDDLFMRLMDSALDCLSEEWGVDL